MYWKKTILVLVFSTLAVHGQFPLLDTSHSPHKSLVLVESRPVITPDSLQFEVVKSSDNQAGNTQKTTVRQKEAPSSFTKRKNSADYKHPHGF